MSGGAGFILKGEEYNQWHAVLQCMEDPIGIQKLHVKPFRNVILPSLD